MNSPLETLRKALAAYEAVYAPMLRSGAAQVLSEPDWVIEARAIVEGRAADMTFSLNHHSLGYGGGRGFAGVDGELVNFTIMGDAFTRKDEVVGRPSKASETHDTSPANPSGYSVSTSLVKALEELQITIKPTDSDDAMSYAATRNSVLNEAIAVARQDRFNPEMLLQQREMRYLIENDGKVCWLYPDGSHRGITADDVKLINSYLRTTEPVCPTCGQAENIYCSDTFHLSATMPVSVDAGSCAIKDALLGGAYDECPEQKIRTIDAIALAKACAKAWGLKWK